LRGDYPDILKQQIVLAAKGSVPGLRLCMVCGEPGINTRVWIPREALRPVDPQYDGIRAYWACAAHLEPAENDPEVQAALNRRPKR
jgi:hypothetical protein